MKFRLSIDKERCKGCALCVAACSRAVLSMSKALNSKGQPFCKASNPDKCVGCLQCADVCPEAAIEIERRGG